jgi:hypothetical protein
VGDDLDHDCGPDRTDAITKRHRLSTRSPPATGLRVDSNPRVTRLSVPAALSTVSRHPAGAGAATPIPAAPPPLGTTEPGPSLTGSSSTKPPALREVPDPGRRAVTRPRRAEPRSPRA